MSSVVFTQIKVPKRPEHFWHRIAISPSGREYYVHTSGIVAVKYKNGKEKVLSAFERDGDLFVKIINKDYKVKHLVAAEVFSKYRKGTNVIFKDGNFRNCDCYNLQIISKKLLGQRTGILAGRNTKIRINNEVYPSIRAAAKALYVSYQTLIDYLNTGRSSVIDTSLKIEKI
ncbi:hypothetical protein IKA92_07385 [bacterium]|nr:hypothetical protein [bacterium]MBR2387099.1 hypothetical protein [bacterium]